MFNSITRAFTGTPPQIGKVYLNIIAKIDYPSSGGTQQVASMFVVNAQNEPPVYDPSLNSMTPAAGADLNSFKDKEMDSIFYQANLKSGEPLPHWAYFFPSSRTLKTHNG